MADAIVRVVDGRVVVAMPGVPANLLAAAQDAALAAQAARDQAVSALNGKLDVDGEGVEPAQFMENLGLVSPAGEVGVINPVYPPGDVRRYGVFPDGVTNWEGDPTYAARMAAINTNSLLPDLLIYWPAGEYHTSLNLGAGHSGSRMHFDEAVFHGILHIIDAITDVIWTGDVSSYDRIGVASGSKRIRLPAMIRMLNNPAKHTQGLSNRGVHFLGATDLTFGTIVIDNTGKTGTGAPNAPDIWSAFTAQGIDPTPGVENGYRITGDKVHIKNAQGHGAYINGIDVNIGEVWIDGYGAQTIDMVSPQAQLSDTDSEAQSEQGKGLWINRSTGRIGRLRIRQANATPAAALYALLVDETGRSGTTNRTEPFNIGEADIEVGGGRGVSINDVLAPAGSINCNIGRLTLRQRKVSGAYVAMEAGYALLNVNPMGVGGGAQDLRTRLAIGTLDVSDAGTALQVQIKGQAGTRNITDVQIGEWSVGAMGSGRLLNVDATAGAGSVTGRIGRLRAAYLGGSQAGVKLITIDSARNFFINYQPDMQPAPNVDHVRLKSTVDCEVTCTIDNINGGVGVELDSTTRTRLSGKAVGFGSAGQGVLFTGTNVDPELGSLVVDKLTHGFKKGTACVFTRGLAKGCVASGTFGTAATDLTVADFPAARQLACAGFAV